MENPIERVERTLAEMAEQHKQHGLRMEALDEQHRLRMKELDERLLRFENGLEHLLEVSARNEELTGKIGALVIQHEDRIKRLEGR